MKMSMVLRICLRTKRKYKRWKEKNENTVIEASMDGITDHSARTIHNGVPGVHSTILNETPHTI